MSQQLQLVRLLSAKPFDMEDSNDKSKRVTGLTIWFVDAEFESIHAQDDFGNEYFGSIPVKASLMGEAGMAAWAVIRQFGFGVSYPLILDRKPGKMELKVTGLSVPEVQLQEDHRARKTGTEG